MARPPRYQFRRMIRLTEYAERLLIRIAAKKETTPSEQARVYVEDGIRKDSKLVEAPKNENN